ncbi:MAG: polyprenyl synthetase family protein [Desulfatibacillaceae bacterium]
MDATRLKEYLEEKRITVERTLASLLDGIEDSGRLAQAMRYSTMAGGKRVRPVLLMAAADAVGGDGGQFVEVGCAIECIHTFSLIHDDLPALDNDDLRRGNPTCHKQYDEATAILAGDALLIFAFEILSDAGSRLGVAPDRHIMAIRAIARASGVHGMCEGQMRDIEGESRGLSFAELEALHRRKTGALIEASTYCGAVLGGGTDEQVAALLEYGRSIGLAFQVADDILNVEGDPELLGKAVGTDAGRNKSTYPGLLGLEQARAFAVKLVDDAMTAISGLGEAGEPLRGLARYIVSRRR